MTKKSKFKKVTIDASKPHVLNPIDYKYLRAGAHSVDQAASPQTGPRPALEPIPESLKIPKIDC